jgi:hypothetical protein
LLINFPMPTNQHEKIRQSDVKHHLNLNYCVQF